MMSMNRQSVLKLILLVGVLMLSCEAFAPATSALHSRPSAAFTTTQKAAFVPSSSIEVSVGTLDPTAILSDLVGGFLGSPAVLAVPIVAALGVATLIAWGIVSYATPEVEDDEQ
jgi:arginine exporter protein ArgO